MGPEIKEDNLFSYSSADLKKILLLLSKSTPERDKMLCGVDIMMTEAKKIEEHVHNRKMPLENIQENARKFYQQCAANFTRLQACEESGSYQVAQVHESAEALAL